MQLNNAWGQPPKLVQNHTLDSTRWENFQYRDGDIVICTWAKSGTTWVQQIVGELLLGPDHPIPKANLSPWIENRSVPLGLVHRILELQTHRRFVKSHLPADALPFSNSARYVYISRDGRDALWSWHNHHRNMQPHLYEAMRRVPGLVGPALEPPQGEVRDYFLRWLRDDGFPLWPFWSHISTWWALRNHPNVLLMRYEDLKRNFHNAVTALSEFLSIAIAQDTLNGIAERCSFSYMKKNANTLLPQYIPGLIGGSETFLNRGGTGYWRDTLTSADLALYENVAQARLGKECANWLARGTDG